MYSDVKPDRWSAEVIAKATRYGLLQGKGKDKNGKLIFDPTAPLTREQAAALAVRIYEATNEDFKEIIDAVLPAVVQIENEASGGLGSGTIITGHGYILTNAHVVCITGEDGKVTVPPMVGIRSLDPVFRGANYAMGPVLAYDVALDLAVVKIMLGDGPDYPYLAIREALPARASKVAAIGSPLGLTRTITEGIVSEYRQFNTDPTGQKFGTFIQTSAQINPGNSGGALVDLDGKLVGVPSQKIMSAGIEGLGFAIDIPTVKRFIKTQYQLGTIPFMI